RTYGGGESGGRKFQTVHAGRKRKFVCAIGAGGAGAGGSRAARRKRADGDGALRFSTPAHNAGQRGGRVLPSHEHAGTDNDQRNDEESTHHTSTQQTGARFGSAI